MADQTLAGKQMPCVREVEFVSTESTLGHGASVTHTERQYGDNRADEPRRWKRRRERMRTETDERKKERRKSERDK